MSACTFYGISYLEEALEKLIQGNREDFQLNKAKLTNEASMGCIVLYLVLGRKR